MHLKPLPSKPPALLVMGQAIFREGPRLAIRASGLKLMNVAMLIAVIVIAGLFWRAAARLDFCARCEALRQAIEIPLRAGFRAATRA